MTTVSCVCFLTGPAVVTSDEIGDPHNLGIRCLVNGVKKQDSNTNQMVFNTQQIVAWVSKFFTLQPGDVILTGTPPGVGVFRKPPEFLKVKRTCTVKQILYYHLSSAEGWA